MTADRRGIADRLGLGRRARAAPVVAALLAASFAPGWTPVAARPAGPDTVRPVPGRVVRVFDAPAHPYGPGHRGVDLAAAADAPVHAARAGRVSWAGEVAGGGWVTVDHGRGLATTYGELEIAVAPGSWVDAGTVIGHVSAGRHHLDWGAVWAHEGRRDYLDPLLLLADLRPVLVAPGAQAGGV